MKRFAAFAAGGQKKAKDQAPGLMIGELERKLNSQPWEAGYSKFRAAIEEWGSKI